MRTLIKQGTGSEDRIISTMYDPELTNTVNTVLYET